MQKLFLVFVVVVVARGAMIVVELVPAIIPVFMLTIGHGS